MVPPPQTLAKTVLPFTGPQLRVLHGVGDGLGVAKAARMAGVHRTTVHIWRKENPEYEAAFQEWKRQARENARAGVISMTDLALRTVKKDMQKGGVNTALKVLQSVGAFDRDQAAPTTGVEIKEDRMLDAEQLRISREERREGLIERHLKTAVARSQRQQAVAAALAKANANALPAPKAPDVDNGPKQYESSGTPAEHNMPEIADDDLEEIEEEDDDPFDDDSGGDEDDDPGPNGLDANCA